MTSHPHAVLLLAAGGSTRLGRPKQLLPWHGQPLVRQVAQILAGTQPEAFVVVTGAHPCEVRHALSGLNWQEAYNSDWQAGLASSLQAGLGQLARSGFTTQGPVLVAMTDQPFLTPAHLHALLKASRQGTGGWRNVVTGYGPPAQTPENGLQRSPPQGVPACLTPDTCARAGHLCGDQGFRNLWLDPPAVIEAPELGLDIDTPADWQEACARLKRFPNADKNVQAPD
ncbi:nucleotidyltransferase family protein [Oecophyllibacter saccharovorans]|uniref:Nucleotidyltransferase family protein n=1 Tax=Oecophyllibacter saccharovorans TaxID=2558360 RepID=A0A506ULI5_9PROT|nr:nucleotidyltransferase family protein [Oecophyllibacter saccharovorans]TPW34211.1 nucleotidyltransferase family protein [Oecophyllibacter saccharovorans]